MVLSHTHQCFLSLLKVWTIACESYLHGRPNSNNANALESLQIGHRSKCCLKVVLTCTRLQNWHFDRHFSATGESLVPIHVYIIKGLLFKILHCFRSSVRFCFELVCYDLNISKRRYWNRGHQMAARGQSLSVSRRQEMLCCFNKVFIVFWIIICILQFWWLPKKTSPFLKVTLKNINWCI